MKTKTKRGPHPERLKINVDWKTAAQQVLRAPKAAKDAAKKKRIYKAT